MRRKLTNTQIEAACRALLERNRRVRVRDVARYLREQHRASGRTERIAAILRDTQKWFEAPPAPADAISVSVSELLKRVQVAEERADRADERERKHQDFWANRYAEKVEELQHKYAAIERSASGVSAEQYLRVCQANAELTRRLAEYEAAGGIPLNASETG
jgi:hypothetical protein